MTLWLRSVTGLLSQHAPIADPRSGATAYPIVDLGHSSLRLEGYTRAVDIDINDVSGPAARSLVAAYLIFRDNVLERDSTGDEGQFMAGIATARELLRRGILLEHLLHGLDLLFRRVGSLAANKGGETFQAVVQYCALTNAQAAVDDSASGDGRASVAGGAGPVGIYDVAQTVIAYFSALDRSVEGEEDPHLADEINSLLAGPNGFDMVIGGALQTIEVAYDLWLYYQILNFIQGEGLVSDPPSPSDRDLIQGVAEKARKRGLDDLAVEIKHMLSQLPTRRRIPRHPETGNLSLTDSKETRSLDS